MRLLLLGCALVITACIQSELVPCGDQLCARGSMCINNTVCASADQLSACSDAADAASCTLTSGTVGRCVMGVCVPSGCGNDRLDVGEVCDDGNVTAGDGCSGTCDSDETCGNGVLDASKGESCDCGSDETKVPASCKAPNSDDPSSACASNCQLRRCGDNMVAGPEQCDGSVTTEQVSCTKYGFYSGAVSCSSLCQFDISGCSERCGDMIIQSAYEVCDTFEPVDQTCLDFGYDMGWLGCTSVCTPRLTDCDRFGWSRVHPRIAVASEVIARGTRVMIRFGDGKVSLLVDDVARDPTGTFDAVALTDTEAYAIGGTNVLELTTTGWQSLSVSPTWNTQPSAAWASPTIGLLVAVSNDSKVYRWNGTAWTGLTLPGGAMTKPQFGGSRSKPYVYDSVSASIAVWNGTGFDAFTPPPNTSSIQGVAETPSTIYVSTEDGLFYRGIAQLNGWSMEGITATRIVANSQSGVDVLTPSGTIVRLGTGGLQFTAPPGTSWIAEDRGQIYVAGVASGVFALLRGAWQSIPLPPTGVAAYTYFHEAAPLKQDMFLLTGSRTYELLPGPRWTSVPVPAGTIDVIKTEDATVSITDTTLTVVRIAGTVVRDFTVITPRMLYYPPGSGTVIIVGDGGAAVYTIATGTLEEQAMNFDLEAVTGNALGAFAVGTDKSTGAGVIVHKLDSGWVVLDTILGPLQALRDVYVTQAGNFFAISRGTIYFGKLGTDDWKEMPVPGADLVAISGTSDSDYFVAGSAQFGFPFSGLAHWDGARFYPVRLPAAGTVRDIHVELGAVYTVLTDTTSGTDSVYSLVRVTRF